MNRKFLIFIFFLINFCKAFTQSLGGMPYENFSIGVEKIFVDSVHDKLIVSSKWMTTANSRTTRGIASWDGTQYDSLGKGVNPLNGWNTAAATVLDGIRYNGKLLVGGTFFSMGNVKATGLAVWDGTVWDSLPVRAFRYGASIAVQGFLKTNNTLYVYGRFDTIVGQKANSLATFNGSTFQPIQLPLDQASISIGSMIVYNNELYIAGNFYSSANPTSYTDILRYNGTDWTDVGGGIKGSASGIGSMVIYNNELYVSGNFEKASGNVDENIMRWDGYNWKSVGWGTPVNNGSIWKLLVHHNKLYAFGIFDEVDGQKASMMAVFDGNQWCTYADSLNNTIGTAAVYHDTIYVAGGFKRISGDTLKRDIAKLLYPNLYANCKPLGIKSELFSDANFKIYPNPSNGKFVVEYSDADKHNVNLSLNDILGQAVYSRKLNNNKEEIDIGFLPNGIYYFTIKIGLEQKTIKIIKN